MAAHVLTALKEIKGWQATHWDQLEAATHLACWTEDLDLDDYVTLSHIIQDEDEIALVKLVDECIEKYEKEWESLGKPSTREQWLKAKYGI